MVYENIVFWKYTIILTILIFILNIILKAYREKLKEDILTNRMFNWIISKKDLGKIRDGEFENWCIFLLKRLGYHNFKIISERSEGGMDIICYKDNDKFYVACVKNSVKDLDDDSTYTHLGRPYIQEFMGLMYHDKIMNGLIMTTGYFSSPAIDYVSTLPDKYKIELIDGDTLTLKHWELLPNRR